MNSADGVIKPVDFRLFCLLLLGVYTILGNVQCLDSLEYCNETIVWWCSRIQFSRDIKEQRTASSRIKCSAMKKVLTGFDCFKKYLVVWAILWLGVKSASTPSDPCSLETKLKFFFLFLNWNQIFSSLFFFNKCSLLGASLFHIDGFRLDNSYAVFPRATLFSPAVWSRMTNNVRVNQLPLLCTFYIFYLTCPGVVF